MILRKVQTPGVMRRHLQLNINWKVILLPGNLTATRKVSVLGTNCAFKRESEFLGGGCVNSKSLCLFRIIHVDRLNRLHINDPFHVKLPDFTNTIYTNNRIRKNSIHVVQILCLVHTYWCNGLKTCSPVQDVQMDTKWGTECPSWCLIKVH